MEASSQYSRARILAYWFGATAPMGVLAWIVWPVVRDWVDQPIGITYWLLMIVGMIWQFVFSVIILRRELGTLRWSVVRDRIWAQAPQNPATGQPSYRAILITVPLVIGVALLQFTPWLDAPMEWLGLRAPEGTDIQKLLDLELHHSWWILAVAFISFLFNYILGEELFWRGVMLPKMSGAFGRGDWIANAVLFTLYHVHKPWTWPSSLLGNLLISWPTRRYRSIWMGIIVHGIEGVFVLIVVTVAVLG